MIKHTVIFLTFIGLSVMIFGATRYNDYHSETDFSLQARVAQCWSKNYDMAAFDYNIGEGKTRQDYKLCFGRFPSNTQRKKSCANNHIHIWMVGNSLYDSYKGNPSYEERWMAHYEACVSQVNRVNAPGA